MFDAIWIARKSNEFAPEPNPVRPSLHMPKEKDYKTNTIAVLKKYANEWNYSWDVPAIYISDMDYYYNQHGYYPFCYDSKASEAAKSAMFRVESMYNEGIYNSYTPQEISENIVITVKWKHLGHNNYEIYVMWS